MLCESNNSLAPIHVLPVFEAVKILEEGRHAFTHGDANHGDISSQKKQVRTRIQISSLQMKVSGSKSL